MPKLHFHTWYILMLCMVDEMRSHSKTIWELPTCGWCMCSIWLLCYFRIQEIIYNKYMTGVLCHHNFQVTLCLFELLHTTCPPLIAGYPIMLLTRDLLLNIKWIGAGGCVQLATLFFSLWWTDTTSMTWCPSVCVCVSVCVLNKSHFVQLAKCAVKLVAWQ